MSCSDFECDVGYMLNAVTATNSGLECDVGYMLNAEVATIPGHTSAVATIGPAVTSSAMLATF